MTASTFPLPPQSLREKIAQLIMVRIGSNLPPIVTATEDEGRIVELLKVCPIGGLLLFNGDATTAETLERLQWASRVPLLVAADIERGVGHQIRGRTLFPHAMAFDRLGVDGPVAIAEFAEALAGEARSVGIHIAFAPVADVNTNPRNPIIAIRALSEDPDRAAELVVSFVRAAEAAGLATTAKHFPGHGDTHQDSHDSLPTVTKSLDELQSYELRPFQAAIDAGCSLVMTAHVAFPTIDPSGLPATLSPVLLKQVLREGMGFRGVVASDSLLMAGVRDQFASEGEMVLAALAAGVDLLLDVRDPAAVVTYLESGVNNGTLDPARVDEAFERVWTLKLRMFGPSSESLPAPAAESVSQLAERIARDAVTIVAGSAQLQPLDTNKLLVAILLKPFASPLDPPEQPLAAALRQHFPKTEYIEIGPQTDAAVFASAKAAALAAPQLLVAMIVRPAAWHTFGLLPAQSDFVRELVSQRPVVVASLGVPGVLQDYLAALVSLCTYSDVPVSQRALAEYLLHGQ